MNKKINIFIADKDEMSVAIIQNYLRDLPFEYNLITGSKVSDIKDKIDDEALNIFFIDASDEKQTQIDIENIENTYKNCKFILSSYNLSSDFVVKVLRKSKKDFIEKPLIKSKLIEIITEIKEKLTSEQDFSGQGKVISVFSNKGGLGKTTIATNLAYELARINKQHKVVLVDMNMFLGDVTTFLDVTPIHDFRDIVSKIDTGYNILDLMTQYKTSNLYIIADSPYRDFSNTISDKDVIKLFNELRKIFKYIVVDTSSAITNKTKDIFNIADMILLISEANLPTLNNCKKCLNFFDRMNIKDKVELILNRYQYSDDCEVSDIEEVLQRKVIVKIPNDWQTITEAINLGTTVRENSFDTEIHDAYVELSDTVMRKLCR